MAVDWDGYHDFLGVKRGIVELEAGDHPLKVEHHKSKA